MYTGNCIKGSNPLVSADQGFQKITDKEDKIWSNGGDNGVDIPSDQNFNNNGLVAPPDCSLHPQMVEVKKEYQNIFTSAASEGKIKIYNEKFFKDLDNVFGMAAN